MVSVSIILLGVALVFFFAGIRIIRPTERGLIETFGKYTRFANPGFQWVIPIIQRMIQVNITEKIADVEQQEIITKDKLNASVDMQVYYKVTGDEVSVKASQYYVNRYEFQIVNLARTTLRAIIGKMNLAEANSERARINDMLMDILGKETKNWGIEIVRTELKEILPPQNVQEAMNRVVIAENEKIAAIDFATSVETKADGEKRATIKEAQGEAEAVRVKAQAQADAIRLVNLSASKYFKGNAQKLKAYEVTQNSLKDNSKILITSKGINPVLVVGGGDIVPLKTKK